MDFEEFSICMLPTVLGKYVDTILAAHLSMYISRTGLPFTTMHVAANQDAEIDFLHSILHFSIASMTDEIATLATPCFSRMKALQYIRQTWYNNAIVRIVSQYKGDRVGTDSTFESLVYKAWWSLWL